jgi:hypothetical protein
MQRTQKPKARLLAIAIGDKYGDRGLNESLKQTDFYLQLPQRA